MKILFVFGLFWCIVNCSNWKDLPNIPKGSRAEYYLSLQDGGYKYGYDTGTGIFAKQNADATNEVKGHFGYSLGNKQIDVKYTSGVEGFSPEVSTDVPTDVPTGSSTQDLVTESEISNESYSFSYSTGDSSRNESGDIKGNIQGQYSYRDDGGEHDLSYNAKDETGFIVTGGNLANPIVLTDESIDPTTETDSITTNGNPIELNGEQIPPIALIWNNRSAVDNLYNFSYDTDISSRNNSMDTHGNIEELIDKNDLTNSSSLNLTANELNSDYSGSEAEENSENNKRDKPELLHKSRGDTETEVTERNLTPNQETSTSGPFSNTDDKEQSVGGNISSLEGSYNFSYSNENSSLTESGDSQSSIDGEHSYVNEAGTYDLSYGAENEQVGILKVSNDSPDKDLKVQPVFEGSQDVNSKLLIPLDGLKLLLVNEDENISLLLSTIVLVVSRPSDQVEWQTTSLVQWPNKEFSSSIQLQGLLKNSPQPTQLFFQPIFSETSGSSVSPTISSPFISYNSPLSTIYFPFYQQLPLGFVKNNTESSSERNENMKKQESSALITNNTVENLSGNSSQTQKNEQPVNIVKNNSNRALPNEKLIQAKDYKNKNFMVEKIIPIPGTHLYQTTSFEKVEKNSEIIPNKRKENKKLQETYSSTLNNFENNENHQRINNSLQSATILPAGKVYRVLSKSNKLRNVSEQQYSSGIELNEYSTLGNVNSVPYNLNNRETIKKSTLILQPMSLVVTGNGGTAISNPISHAILKKGVPTDIYFRPEAVAIAGVGGKAHAQADLIIDYINKK